jgi:hypothetical protein
MTSPGNERVDQVAAWKEKWLGATKMGIDILAFRRCKWENTSLYVLINCFAVTTLFL